MLSSSGVLCRSSQEHESCNLWDCGLGKRRKDSQWEGTKYREEKRVGRSTGQRVSSETQGVVRVGRRML